MIEYRNLPDYSAEDEASRIWSCEITGGMLVGEYDDGDLIINGWASDQPNRGILLIPDQIRTLVELAAIETPPAQRSTSLGENSLEGEVRAQYDDGSYRFKTKNMSEFRVTEQQLTDIVEAMHMYSPRYP